uniref:ATP-dependent (S)-NAD(P)H-hydrate dehydratase n=3 Tax=Glossina TaxID=44049 RepID=A0A1B0G896_GLOMM
MHSTFIRSNPRVNIYLLSQLKCHPSPTVNDNCTISSHSKMSNNRSSIEIPVETQKLLKLLRTTVPKLTNTKHKGEYGRIGVVGGSLEYTGAPYFAAISALKAGADLAHVFCQREAAVVIKSYSPELIVHPLLDAANAVELISPWLERLHVVIIGPGLGREPETQKTVIELIKVCLKQEKPLVIDADGLALLIDRLDLIQGQRNIILTPNAIEFQRLFGPNTGEKSNYDRISKLGSGIVVLEKGAIDRIHIPHTSEIYGLPPGGSGRRCGGQGDLLCGTLAVFYYWTLESRQANPAFLAAFAASYLVKECNASAFHKLGRGMLASDMVDEIPPVFARIFEPTEGAC